MRTFSVNPDALDKVTTEIANALDGADIVTAIAASSTLLLSCVKQMQEALVKGKLEVAPAAVIAEDDLVRIMQCIQSAGAGLLGHEDIDAMLKTMIARMPVSNDKPV